MFVSGPRSAENAMRLPSGNHAGSNDIEVAARELARRRAAAEGKQPEVRSAHDVAGLVVSEVQPRDAARGRRMALPLLPDDEAVVARLRQHGQPVAGGTPVGTAHAVLELRQLPGLPALEGQHPRLSDGIVHSDRRPDEGDRTTVRRDGR